MALHDGGLKGSVHSCTRNPKNIHVMGALHTYVNQSCTVGSNPTQPATCHCFGRGTRFETPYVSGDCTVNAMERREDER